MLEMDDSSSQMTLESSSSLKRKNIYKDNYISSQLKRKSTGDSKQPNISKYCDTSSQLEWGHRPRLLRANMFDISSQLIERKKTYIVERYKPSRMSRLLKHVNKRINYDKTLLHLRAPIGHTERGDVFIKVEATIDAENLYNKTPLHLSADKGHKEVVEILLKAGATVNAEDQNKKTPLHLSADKGHKEVVEILLKAGATIDAENLYKKTPLHFLAAQTDNQNTDTVRDFVSQEEIMESQFPGFSDSESSELSSITEKLEDLKAKVSPEHREGWEISQSHDVSADIILMPPKIRTTKVKKEICHNKSPDSQVYIRKNDIPTISQAVIHQERNIVDNDDDSSSSKDSSEESSRSSDSGPSQLTNIRQQVQDHWAKFSSEHTEGCETDRSDDQKAGIMLMPPKIRTTKLKK